jgi:hypothetical protein
MWEFCIVFSYGLRWHDTVEDNPIREQETRPVDKEQQRQVKEISVKVAGRS